VVRVGILGDRLGLHVVGRLRRCGGGGSAGAAHRALIVLLALVLARRRQGEQRCEDLHLLHGAGKMAQTTRYCKASLPPVQPTMRPATPRTASSVHTAS